MAMTCLSVNPFLFVAAAFLAQVIAATNRVDILDPALLRSGRLDRKIEFPMPNEEARARIMQIHSRKMNVRWAWSLRAGRDPCRGSSSAVCLSSCGAA